MSTAKFKVGDKVRVIYGNAIGHADTGWLGVISKVDRNGVCDCEVMFSKCTEWTHFGDDHCESKYRYYNSSNLEHLELPELVEEKPKHRFKVGDKVVALKDNGYNITTDGWKGIVKKVWFAGEICMMSVVGKGLGGVNGIKFDVEQKGFELVESVQPWKIIIESSGDTTTAKYIEGRTVVKTESVKRYHTDEYSVEKAVEAVTKKLFPEDELEAFKNKYKPGDLVECISDCYDTFGKRGYLVKLVSDGTWIVDFKVEYDDTHTCRYLPGKTGLWLCSDLEFKKVK